MKNIWRWLCWPINMAAIIILIGIGLKWWQASLIVLVLAFVNYMDGLCRVKREIEELLDEEDI